MNRTIVAGCIIAQIGLVRWIWLFFFGALIRRCEYAWKIFQYHWGWWARIFLWLNAQSFTQLLMIDKLICPSRYACWRSHHDRSYLNLAICRDSSRAKSSKEKPFKNYFLTFNCSLDYDFSHRPRFTSTDDGRQYSYRKTLLYMTEGGKGRGWKWKMKLKKIEIKMK